MGREGKRKGGRRKEREGKEDPVCRIGKVNRCMATRVEKGTDVRPEAIMAYVRRGRLLGKTNGPMRNHDITKG